MTLLRAIIVEDSEDDLLLLLRALKKGGFETIYSRVETEEELRTELIDPQWQLVISDHAMPRFSAPEALEVMKSCGHDLPFIIVSGTIGEEIAVAAMKAGAHDYIMKDNLSRLAPAVERELREAENRQKQKVFEEQVNYLSLHDRLTGLYNRLYFENEIERLEGGREYPVIIFSADLDGLKLINATMGQKEGDRILKVCAELLKKPLRKGDVLARIGGDEFAAILPRIDQGAGAEIAERIYREVEQYNRDNAHFPISLSLGFAVSSGPERSLEETMKAADSIMRLDKQNRSESTLNQVVSALLAALSERDFIAEGHAERLQEHCLKMGRAVGLDRHQLASLSLVAQVHDLGKVGIPDQILFKESALSDEEWAIMRLHPEKGYRIAQSSPDLNGIADLILRHHEKWDGSGYPLGLKGEEIPVECRILAIVDAYDAMTNDRPYRRAKTRQEAIDELEKFAGTQFDPLLVDQFLKII